MKRLWIADIHANLPAFEAVLRDAGPVDEVVFLGDVVGYGPHPSDCVDRLISLQAEAVLGNHDAAVLSLERRDTPRGGPVDWDQWTRDQLTESQCSYLGSLPRALDEESCGVMVKAMHQPTGAPYLHPAMPDHVLASHLSAVPHAAIYCGHSHRQIDRTFGERRLVCIPPVGQPRNGDPRAGYAIEDHARLSFRFVSYNVDRVVADVERIGLPEGFCRRWVRFLRTGADIEWSREYPGDKSQAHSTP